MRPIYYFLFLSIITRLSVRAQLDRAWDAQGAYHNTSYTIHLLKGSEKAKAIQLMDAVAETFKKYYPQPVGVDVGPYAGVWDASTNEKGPYCIYVTIPFYDLYKTKAGGTEPSGEYASSYEIWINNIGFILQGNTVTDGIYRAPKPGIPVNGFPKFNNMILILPQGKSLPWRPATRQDYIEHYIISQKNVTNAAPYVKQNIARAEAMLASMSSSEKKETAYIKKEKFRHSEYGYDNWEGFQSASDTTADQLVTIDENFYDKSLPRNSIQVIVIERSYGTGFMNVARARPEEVALYKERTGRINSIVRSTGFLPSLQQLLGKNGVMVASAKKTVTKKAYVIKKVNRRYIDLKVDSLFRNYSPKLPSAPVTVGIKENNSSTPDLPPRNEKKLLLASRKLDTKEQVVQFLDELDQKLTEGLGTTVSEYGSAIKNNMASYGYWLMNNPRQSLLLALKAAKQQPDNDCMLNNLGANLSECGIGYMAIPLYIVCIKKEPDNSTITNNLGQSYLELGDVQNAETWLRKAIASTPYHHHANNSLGIIYEKQGRKNEAIKCYENSLRGSFTIRAINGLNRLKKESALKLMDYVRHRYKQPDYLNFNKVKLPAQCMNINETEARKKEHQDYQKMLDVLYRQFSKQKQQEYPLAQMEAQDVLKRSQQGKSFIKPFQPFANAVLISLQKEFGDKIFQLEKDLIALKKERTVLDIEYDTVMKLNMAPFEERSEKVGEGNGDPTLDEEICEAKNAICNYYLPLYADLNEREFHLIVTAYKDYLNDRLYWVRLASSGDEEYKVAYYDLAMTMINVLKDLRLTTLTNYCSEGETEAAKNEALEIKEPKCPLPVGIEIPFVIGKVSFDCEGWGLEIGEAIVLNIDRKYSGETTIAFGPGESFYTTPKIFGHEEYNLKPGIDVGAKGQIFFTFEGSELIDGGFLWEAEIDFKGIGKPAELKQNFTWAVNKGFTYEGQLTTIADKIFGLPPEVQVNKNVKIFKGN